MGWYINLVKNELPITSDMASEIDKLPSYMGITVRDGALVFKRAHLEHMDYVWQPDLQAILLKHKANGEVLFSSSDGDNAGKTWGYRFTDGALTELVRANGEWIEDDGQDHTTGPTGFKPPTIEEAKVGDTVAIAVIGFGMTSYEEGTVGDILPDGAIVVDGREYRAPTYYTSGDMLSFRLVPYHTAQFDDEEV